MANIATIGIAMEADTSSWTDGLLEGIESLDRIKHAADEAQQSMAGLDFSRMAAPAAEKGDAGAASGDVGSEALARLHTAMAPIAEIGTTLSAQLTAGLTPLTQIGARIEAEVNVMGGTFQTLAQRIDAAMKFPTLERALGAVQQKIRSGVSAAANVATEDLTRTQAATLRLGPAADKAIGAFLGFKRVAGILGSIGNVAARPLTSLSKISFAAPTASAGQLNKQLQVISPTAQHVATAARRMGSEIALALGAFALVYKATTAVKDFVVGGIKGASNLNESINKTAETFGAASTSVVANADAMAKAYGIPKREILDAASSIGLIAKGAGQSSDKAATLANTMSQLAADASSFYNVPIDTALEKIRSGLVGEAEPLRAFGVLLSEEAVSAQAAAMGLTKVHGKLTEGSKVMARAALIQKGLATSSGDLARTLDSPANAMRNLSGRMENFASDVGAILLPALSTGMAAAGELLTAITASFEANKTAITEWGANLATTIGTASVVIRNFGSVWEIVQLGATEKVANLLAYIEVIPANLGLIAEYIAGNWKELILDGIQAVGVGMFNLDQNIKNFSTGLIKFLQDPTKGFQFEWTPLLAGFEATAAQLPRLLAPVLVDMSDQIRDAGEKIFQEEQRNAAALAKGPAGPKPVLPPDAKAADKDKYKGTGAVEMGSKEAISAIARFRNGSSGKDKAADETAKNTAKTVSAIDRLNAAIAAGKGTTQSISLALASL